MCVRHGRTAWNAERRFQGHTDIPLDDEGRAQARALAAHLADERFDLAVASDLSRARATADAIVARHRHLALTFDPDLREMMFGEWEGLTWTQIVERWPELEAEDEASPKFSTPLGGESFEAVVARARRALDRVAAQITPEGRALIVSHAGMMHALAAAFTGDDPTFHRALGIKFVPASIMRVTGSPVDGWTIVGVNETAEALR